MELNLNVLRLASGLAAHSAARQQVIAENIAHADTPGYRARDIADFAATLDGTPGLRGADDPAGAHRLRRRPARLRAARGAALGAETPNGNTVSRSRTR